MSAKVYSSDIESADLDFESGIACLRVRKSPAKLSATEDAATVLPISPAALVLAVADGVGGAPGGRDAANEVMSSIAAITLPEDNEDASLRSAIIDSIEHANREDIRTVVPRQRCRHAITSFDVPGRAVFGPPG